MIPKKRWPSQKFFENKMLQWLPSFFKNPCSGSITKRHDRSTYKAHEERYKPVLSCFLPKGKVCNIKHVLGRALLELRHEIKEAEIHLISGIAWRITS
ncbi:MAG: hypothetical protein FDX02_08510 [Chlorobium sp.]|nr:MAG: hypothetical protein FDX02_08510 [Chlorobium sp.]